MRLKIRMNHVFTMPIDRDVHNIGDIISIVQDFYHGLRNHEDEDIINVELPGGTAFSSSMYDSFNNKWDLYVEYPGCGPEWVASFRMNER